MSLRHLSLIAFTCLFTLPAVGQGNANGDPFRGSDPFGANGNRTPQRTPQRTQQRTQQTTQKPQLAKKPKAAPPGGYTIATDQHLDAVLGELTSQSFIETPLADAMMQISKTHEIPIVIDRRALEEIGLSADATVTIDLRDVTLRSYLRLMLRDLDLTYMIGNEVLLITTLEAAEQTLQIQMYKLKGKLASRGPEVVKVIKQTVSPASWEELGGPSTMSNLDHVLVVSATSDLQHKVRSFLAQLSETYESE